MNFHLLAGLTAIVILIAVSASRDGLRAWRARVRYARVARSHTAPPRRSDRAD